MASSQQAIIPGKHEAIIDEMMRSEEGEQGATNMASNQQTNIPKKHQVIVNEIMMTGKAGGVGDMLMRKEGKQGFIFEGMLKGEESKQGIYSSHMSKVGCNHGRMFEQQGIYGGVIHDHAFKKHARKRRVYGIAKVGNRTLDDLRFVRGDELATRTIPQGGHVSFVTKNPRGHVIYDGTNVQGGPRNCAWLLAWCVQSDGYGNQVYVECGARGSITAMPDYKIYENLDAFGSRSTYVDRETKTDASARIEAICTAPRLGCVFDVGGNRS